nr:caspase-7-like [Leptinotarsa decemlineata]
MLQEYKDVIIRNFVILMKECDVHALAKLMVNKGVFNDKEINNIFSSNDERHNKRIFFFSIQKKDTSTFKILVNSLRETNQNKLADLLMPKHTGCVPYQAEQVFDELPDDDMLDINRLNIYVNNSTESIHVKVIPSTKFYDTYLDNPNIDFYYTRSKKRGRVLIINNYEFDKIDDNKHPYRNGAEVDNENLKSLFIQMGGWEIEHHNNKSASEMEIILNNFSQQRKNVNYDIIFVIIMSHGSEQANDTIIYGRDHNYIHSLQIQRKFSNEHSKTLRGKPKVFILPVCRGSVLDIAVPHDQRPRTETDSAFRKGESKSPVSSIINLRSEEDMLVGYSTLLGYKAHRDPNRGSWYIELMCDVFMNHAHDTPVDNLLSIIDNRLRRRMSENQTMQTAEHRNKGFKKLYLHPGIFSENDDMKKFHE